MLQLGTVTIDAGHEPPRPAIQPKAMRGELVNRWAGLSVTTQGVEYGRRVTFVSSDRQGFVTHQQMLDLIALYEAGGSFTLTTDLLLPLGQAARAYTAIFAPDAPPSFAPAAPDSSLYGFEIIVIAAGTI